MEILLMLPILVFLSIEDIRTKTVHIAFVIAFVSEGFVFSIVSLVYKRCTVMDVILSLIPGIAVLLVSFFSEEVGKADGIIIIGIGLFSGLYKCLEALFFGCVIMAALSVVLLFLKKAKRKTKLPFVPFLTLGLIFLSIISICENGG